MALISGAYAGQYRADIRNLFRKFNKGEGVYINDDSNILVKSPSFIASEPGGILADEMGLGKTLEVRFKAVCYLSGL